VSTKDANKKFLRSLPSSWSQVSLIMRIKPGVDTLSFDDLYNNLIVFESNVKGSTASSSSIQNVAFVSYDSTNSTNEVSTTYGVSTSSGHNSQKEGSSSYTSDLMYSFFANQSSGPQLDHKDLEQTVRKLHFDAKEPAGFDKTKVESFNCHNTGHFARECRSKGNQESVDWTGHAEDETKNYALMAFNSSNSSSDTEVTSCSKVCKESYAKLKKLYDKQREQLGAEKEKEELKTKLENFQSSSKGLSKLLNSQMSAKDKSGLGYGTQIHEGVLSYENEVLESVFKSRSSDVEDSTMNDRSVKVEGMHAVPPPMTGIYMPYKSDFGIDDVETLESVPKPVESKPKAVSEPKVWSDAPIIKEYESNSDDEYVFKATVEQEKPSCAFINIVKHVKTPRQTVKDQGTCCHNPKVHKRD
nr:hypothetical protein [Tanacetum cinerariifolium]